jgi:hypothetical protein
LVLKNNKCVHNHFITPQWLLVHKKKPKKKSVTPVTPVTLLPSKKKPYFAMVSAVTEYKNTLLPTLLPPVTFDGYSAIH